VRQGPFWKRSTASLSARQGPEAPGLQGGGRVDTIKKKNLPLGLGGESADARGTIRASRRGV